VKQEKNGEKGGRGHKGLQGDQGIRGDTGEKGNLGDRGEQGIQGIQGVQGLHGDQGIQGEKGIDGTRGEKGDNPLHTLQKSVKTYTFFSSAVSSNEGRFPDFTYYLPTGRKHELNKFSNLYVQFDHEPVNSPSKNRNIHSKKVQFFHSSCKKDQILFRGDCKWGLFKFKAYPTWCRVKDFKPGKRGCTDCVVNIDKTVKRDFEGEQKVDVVRKIRLNINGYIQRLKLTKNSCKIIRPLELNSEEFSQCGFFCFFHEVEQIYTSDKTFTCKYVPPSFYGVTSFGVASFTGLSNSTTAEDPFAHRIQTIKLEIFCGDR